MYVCMYLFIPNGTQSRETNKLDSSPNPKQQQVSSKGLVNTYNIIKINHTTILSTIPRSHKLLKNTFFLTAKRN